MGGGLIVREAAARLMVEMDGDGDGDGDGGGGTTHRLASRERS